MIRMPAPSPMTKPSRSLSQGRLAWAGSSLRVESARIAANPPTPIGVMAASVPPAIITSASLMIAGGTEAAITPMGVGGFAAMRALSTRNDDPAHASRPWDKDRDGFVIGEGAGILVLEELEFARRRGAR